MSGSSILFPELSYRVNGALFDGHNALGRFAREVQYAHALAARFDELDISYLRERDIPFAFHDSIVRGNIVDFLIERCIILALKAKAAFDRMDFFQTYRYLDAAQVPLAILVNFHDRKLRPRRMIRKGVDIRDHSRIRAD